MYPAYAEGGDILSFDIYPVNDGVGLEAVPKGVDNLREWSNYQKPVIVDIEASDIDDTTRPSPAQIRSEVWMALGMVRQESSTSAIDLRRLSAPVLNTASVGNGVAVKTSAQDQPIDVMLKRYERRNVSLCDAAAGRHPTGTFTLRDVPATASAKVIGEARTISVANGTFQDGFDSYGAHLYELTY